MKIGTITTPNAKGQIVIPKAMRELLGMGVNTPVNVTVRGEGIYIYPIRGVLGKHETEESYLKVLEKTAGSWSGNGWEKTRKKRQRIELAAAARAKREEW